jgi:hypothetical protein
MVNEPKHPIESRLEEQIGWYDRKSQTAQRRYKALKLAQVALTGLIPLAAAFPISELQLRWVAAALGLLVLVIETMQQLNQDQQNRIAYRSTCEALKHEKYLYLAAAGPYRGADSSGNRIALLADRIEGLISQEHAKWISAQEHAQASDKPAARPPIPRDGPKEGR